MTWNHRDSKENEINNNNRGSKREKNRQVKEEKRGGWKEGELVIIVL